MKIPIIVLAISITCSVSFDCCFAQNKEDIDHVVYLIGNTAGSVINESNLVSLQEQLLAENSPFTVLHLGDIINPEQVDSWKTELDLLFKLTEGRNKGQLIFTPGDKDWNNSDRDGLKMVRKLEKRVEQRQESANIFLPSDGCPGPEVIDLSPQLRLIVINTQWWLHPFDIPEAPDADCKNLTKEEFI